ncbi:hypothetical protein Tco_1372914, partial [Tanacetum coccineum]
QNDFIFVDASRMEEIEKLSANICLMARIQPANFDSNAGPSYDSAFLSEKQTALAISTTEAEYVSAGKACQQALWMKQALVDYDIRLDDIPIMCDNKGAIDLSKSLVENTLRFVTISFMTMFKKEIFP